ncbi:MAG: 4a-hydroxytetrahydrobiopterin dehydratase [Deltaproteobacteria bacterium]
MSTNLRLEKCVACNRDAPRVTDEERRELSAQIPEWEIIEVGEIPRLTRLYKVKNFVAALDLTNRVGAIAEEQAHHPEIVTEWGKVRVTWWTHKIKGLHRNDFVMAARTDELAAD